MSCLHTHDFHCVLDLGQDTVILGFFIAVSKITKLYELTRYHTDPKIIMMIIVDVSLKIDCHSAVCVCGGMTEKGTYSPMDRWSQLCPEPCSLGPAIDFSCQSCCLWSYRRGSPPLNPTQPSLPSGHRQCFAPCGVRAKKKSLKTLCPCRYNVAWGLTTGPSCETLSPHSLKSAGSATLLKNLSKAVTNFTDPGC